PSNFYTPGPALALDKYPALEWKIRGSGRIQTEYMTSSGKNLVARSLYDTKYGARCDVRRLSDGGTWCVPGAVDLPLGSTGNFFADSQCSSPVAQPNEPTGGPPTKHLFAVVYPSGNACGQNVALTLHSLVEHASLIYYQEGPGI